MEKILASLESLFLEFNLRRLLFWLFMIGLLAFGLYAYERTTGYVYFARLAKRMALLRDLNALAQGGAATNPELKPIYTKLVAELNSYTFQPLSIKELPALKASNFEKLVKFTGGALLGIAMLFAGLSERKKKVPRWESLVGGATAVAIIGGTIGLIIPTIYSPWLNAAVYPVLQVALIFGVAGTLARKKQVTPNLPAG
jgi:hypothetical protein